MNRNRLLKIKSFAMNPIKFLKTIYLGNRYCTKIVIDTHNNTFEFQFELIQSLLLKIKDNTTGIIYDDIESNVGRTIEKNINDDTVSLISKCYFGGLFDTSTIQLSRIRVAQEIDNFTLRCRKFFKVLHKELGINIWTGE